MKIWKISYGVFSVSYCQLYNNDNYYIKLEPRKQNIAGGIENGKNAPHGNRGHSKTEITLTLDPNLTRLLAIACKHSRLLLERKRSSNISLRIFFFWMKQTVVVSF